MSDLAHMRIDTAEALVELHEFVEDSVYNREENEKRQSAEDAFWNL